LAGYVKVSAECDDKRLLKAWACGQAVAILQWAMPTLQQILPHSYIKGEMPELIMSAALLQLLFKDPSVQTK
jgi:hypothetical protein